MRISQFKYAKTKTNLPLSLFTENAEPLVKKLIYFVLSGGVAFFQTKFY